MTCVAAARLYAVSGSSSADIFLLLRLESLRDVDVRLDSGPCCDVKPAVSMGDTCLLLMASARVLVAESGVDCGENRPSPPAASVRAAYRPLPLCGRRNQRSSRSRRHTRRVVPSNPVARDTAAGVPTAAPL